MAFVLSHRGADQNLIICTPSFVRLTFLYGANNRRPALQYGEEILDLQSLSRRQAPEPAAGERARGAPHRRLPRLGLARTGPGSHRRSRSGRCGQRGTGRRRQRDPGGRRRGTTGDHHVRPARRAARHHPSPASTSGRMETSCASSPSTWETDSWRSRSPPATHTSMPPRHSPRQPAATPPEPSSSRPDRPPREALIAVRAMSRAAAATVHVPSTGTAWGPAPRQVVPSAGLATAARLR